MYSWFRYIKNFFRLLGIWIVAIWVPFALYQNLFLFPWKINYSLHKDEYTKIINFLTKNKDKFSYIYKNSIVDNKFFPINKKFFYTITSTDWKQCILFEPNVDDKEKSYLLNEIFSKKEDIVYCDTIYDKDTIDNVKYAGNLMNTYHISTSDKDVLIWITNVFDDRKKNDVPIYYYHKWAFNNEKCINLSWCQDIINDDIWVFLFKKN